MSRCQAQFNPSQRISRHGDINNIGVFPKWSRSFAEFALGGSDAYSCFQQCVFALLVHIHNGLVHIHNGLVHIHNGLVRIHNGLVHIHNGLVHIHNGLVRIHNGLMHIYSYGFLTISQLCP